LKLLPRLSIRRRRAAILCFHDVRNGSWLRHFLGQLRERADVVHLGSLVERQERHDASGAKPQAPVALTFDDGYKSLRTVVEPVCSDMRLPFTTFVCSEVLTGGPAPWYDRANLIVRQLGSARAARYWGFDGDPGRRLLSALKEAPQRLVLDGLARAESAAAIDPRPLCERFMREDDLVAVARNPLVTVASHTHSHPILANLDPEAQRAEIFRGVDLLRGLCASPVQYFAYPNGKLEDFDGNVIRALQEAGIRAAVTTVQRPVLPQDDVMCLPRLGVSEGDSIGKLETKWTLPWLSAGDMRENRCRRRYSGFWSKS
jgi:peptidoglycan/xylan/chitin deacetylase (PgdA/CDA1 family)